MNETLTVDDLVLEVRRSDRRKTLEINLDRHGALIIASPSGVGTEVMTAFVEEKRFWRNGPRKWVEQVLKRGALALLAIAVLCLSGTLGPAQAESASPFEPGAHSGPKGPANSGAGGN